MRWLRGNLPPPARTSLGSSSGHRRCSLWQAMTVAHGGTLKKVGPRSCLPTSYFLSPSPLWPFLRLPSVDSGFCFGFRFKSSLCPSAGWERSTSLIRDGGIPYLHPPREPARGLAVVVPLPQVKGMQVMGSTLHSGRPLSRLDPMRLHSLMVVRLRSHGRRRRGQRRHTP